MIYTILFMVIGSYPDTISYRALFAHSQLSFETIQDFDLVTLDNAQHIRSGGCPALPCKTYLFVIPAGSRIANVDYAVLDSSSIDGTYEIWSAQHSIPISWDDSIPATDPDSAIVRECLDGTAAGSGYYRANFGGHGGAEWIAANATGMPGSDKVIDDDLRGLGGDDGMYCTGHAFNCLTGRFITPDPDVPVSIAETWVGADLNLDEAPLGPAYTGNSIGGLDYPEPGASSSHKLNRWILEGLYSGGPAEGGAWGIGDVLCYAKTIYSRDYLGDAYPTQIPDPIEIGDEAWEPMWNLKGCNLAGDPAMPIWVREPWGWTSTYPSTVECPAQFTIQVETGGGVALEGVRVCLMMQSQRGFEIYERGFTDASGEYSTRLEPSFSGTMFVTLTKQGYLPDEGEVSLLVD